MWMTHHDQSVLVILLTMQWAVHVPAPTQHSSPGTSTYSGALQTRYSTRRISAGQMNSIRQLFSAAVEAPVYNPPTEAELMVSTTQYVLRTMHLQARKSLTLYCQDPSPTPQVTQASTITSPQKSQLPMAQRPFPLALSARTQRRSAKGHDSSTRLHAVRRCDPNNFECTDLLISWTDSSGHYRPTDPSTDTVSLEWV
ncbi:hypothetical protein EDD17DRAFT_1086148 [Pisolithus thermaeus]|nr:hypothetical protein EDD17DRAFT_1086148 [Pisolithus thermaeus]